MMSSHTAGRSNSTVVLGCIFRPETCLGPKTLQVEVAFAADDVGSRSKLEDMYAAREGRAWE